MRLRDYWRVVGDVVKSRGRELQRYGFFDEVWDALDGSARLIIVRAPTGSGKTEAASAPFLNDLRSGQRRWLSMIHVLPTRALVNSMRWRHAGAIASVGIENAVVTCEYGQLMGVKPHLDGDVVVTTYDTLLYRFYGVRFADPHVIGQVSKILNSLLVLDEVQLLQDEYWYAMSLLPHHLSALLGFGVQTILMTATLPSMVLEDIEGHARRVVSHDEALSSISSHDKPARGKMSLELMKGLELPTSREELTRLIREYYAGDGSILIIVNTVERAVEIYMSLLKAYRGKAIELEPMLLHSRLRQGVRRKVEAGLEANRNGKFILVATQVVEAGLDVDSTLLLTEISPIDSLIQRLGRCARRRNGLAIVYTESESASKVYPEPLVKRTRDVIVEYPDLLAESPSDLDAAQEIVDQIYTSEIIQQLRRYSDAARTIIDWLHKHWTSELDIDSWTAHHPPDQLLRIGIELQAYRPRSLEEYKRLINGEAIEIEVEDLEGNLVRMSFRREEETSIRMPAILHTVSGHDYCVILEALRGGDRRTVELRPSRMRFFGIRDAKMLAGIFSGRRVFLLNPASYTSLVLDGVEFELGVVNPWRKMWENA